MRGCVPDKQTRTDHRHSAWTNGTCPGQRTIAPGKRTCNPSQWTCIPGNGHVVHANGSDLVPQSCAPKGHMHGTRDCAPQSIDMRHYQCAAVQPQSVRYAQPKLTDSTWRTSVVSFKLTYAPYCRIQLPESAVGRNAERSRKVMPVMYTWTFVWAMDPGIWNGPASWRLATNV